MKLIISNISKSYGSNRALSGFSAELSPGIYALLGPNGSGKSTLMNILTDNLSADSGTVSFVGDGEDDGKARNVKSMGVEFREKIGFMPQYPGLYPNFTVESFLWYMATLKEIKRDDARRQISEILADVDLEDVPGRKISALSGGMKQRLALAQAVLGDPSILILDEPTAGLDPKQRIAVRNYISKISMHKIVLIATHVVQDVEYIARSVIMLKRGVITDNAPPHELTAKIAGKVWITPTAEADVVSVQESHRVTNISHDEMTGAINLRIIADEAPTAESRAAAPTLEDYYLYVFGSEGQQ